MSKFEKRINCEIAHLGKMTVSMGALNDMACAFYEMRDSMKAQGLITLSKEADEIASSIYKVLTDRHFYEESAINAE